VVPEQESNQPNPYEVNPDLEWRFPASLATKHAVLTAVDNLTPPPGTNSSGMFEIGAWGTVDIHRSDTDSGAQWLLIVTPPPHRNLDGKLSDTEYVVGSDAVATEEWRIPSRYLLTRLGEDDVTFQKTEWASRPRASEPLDVSEAEAKVLLKKLGNVRRSSEQPDNINRSENG